MPLISLHSRGGRSSESGDRGDLERSDGGKPRTSGVPLVTPHFWPQSVSVRVRQAPRAGRARLRHVGGARGFSVGGGGCRTAPPRAPGLARPFLPPPR
ncbi:hypothetical protein MDA_GLEAN10003966 [Myotis davidii]|uniref:Uncharacterized protein n=1 Tax=Myotis davidii TaxID=225400 RepID=L5LRC9_MYODS|nr:hypothetical protein MDA_GLEAN10003966 [Myotis davidii]